MHRMSLSARLSLFLLPAALPLGCGGDTSVGSTSDATTGVDTDGNTGTGTTSLDPDSSGGGTLDGSGSSGTPGVGCDNGIQDEDETDVDCGGPTCEPCGPGQGCMGTDDCTSLVCDDGVCQAPSCYDGVHNGSEGGVDCGGPCPNACPETGCRDDGDCDDGFFCDAPRCLPAACNNGVQDTGETDVDCGGPDCAACDAGSSCQVGSDCVAGVCDPDTHTCAVPACDDWVQNGSETDIDCGGSCPNCPNGADGRTGDDCQSLSCQDGVCASPTCDDGVQNGNETDIDCGGPNCDDCGTGQGCANDHDCVMDVCLNGFCAAATCGDGVLNGDETDVDCGGSCGATCGVGDDCQDAGDCVEGVCEFNVCSAPDCFDDMHNGSETDTDCGGACGATCEPGEGCEDGSDCVEGVCDLQNMICALPTCDDGVGNGDETDTDCGGSCGATCGSGDVCEDAGDCASGVCTFNVCQAPSCNDGVQNGDEGGVDCQGSCPQPCSPEGEVQANTYALDFQTQPAVAAAPDGDFFVVVWTSSPVGHPAQDGSGRGVFAQVYDANANPVGSEIQVNTTTTDDQQFPTVAAGNDGFVIAWQSTGQDGSGTGIYAQRFNQAGAAVGNEFRVNTVTEGAQRRPSAAMEDGGAFVICWDSAPVGDADIRCQRYNAAGAAQGGEIAVNTTTSGSQVLPSVAMDLAGNFVVAWQSQAALVADGTDIRAQRFDANGATLGSEVLVNVTTAEDQGEPSVARDADGDYVIAWTSSGQDGSSTGIYARRYSGNGTAQGGEFQVNTTTLGAQNRPQVAMNAAGDFVVVWQTPNDGNVTGIFAQRYHGTGAANGVEFIANETTTGNQEEPDIVIRGADEPIVVWNGGNLTSRNVYFRRFIGQL